MCHCDVKRLRNCAGIVKIMELLKAAERATDGAAHRQHVLDAEAALIRVYAVADILHGVNIFGAVVDGTNPLLLLWQSLRAGDFFFLEVVLSRLILRWRWGVRFWAFRF